MSKGRTKKLLALIDSLEQISPEKKEQLYIEVNAIKKEFEKSEFKFVRTSLDRKIAEKALKASIEELENHQQQLEEANHELSKQKNELKLKNQIIQEKSLELAENLKKMELSFKEMEHFAYIASHDLKSPLRTIGNFAQLLKRRNFSQLDEESKEFVDFIVSGAKQMHDVIRNSLEYSRVGMDDGSFRKTNLNNTLEIVRFNLKKEIEKSGAQIICEALPILKVNKTGILQLFQNLLSNAIKFRGDAAPIIKITHEKKEGYYEFNVSDNGIGLDEQFQEKAFLPFQRLGNLHKPGSGIGLAICKKIARMHGGDIWFKSNEKGGTTFTFTLSCKIDGQSILSKKTVEFQNS
ncbi:MAG TPA: hypothetical protein ENJ95_03000 [Bacteroidetes bacterium]|nr:hypothetical protein [Bacteroidota bacterium]